MFAYYYKQKLKFLFIFIISYHLFVYFKNIIIIITKFTSDQL